MTQEQLDSLSDGFKRTEVYEEITAKQQDLSRELSVLEKKVDSGFEKSRVAMVEQSKDIEAINTKVDGMKTLIETSIQQVLKKLDEREIANLTQEIRTLKKKEDREDARKWDTAKILLGTTAGVVGTYLSAKYIKGF